MSRLSEQELIAKLDAAYEKIEMGVHYRHNKTGREYVTHGIGLIESTLEPAVVYRDVENPELYFLRPVDDFIDEVEIDDEKVPRFKKL